MNTAHPRAEAVINTRNGFTVDFVDFADFAIASLPDGADQQRARQTEQKPRVGTGECPGASVRVHNQHVIKAIQKEQ